MVKIKFGIAIGMMGFSFLGNPGKSYGLDYRVIAYPELPFDKISERKLHDFYLLKTTTWPNGKSVVLVTLRRDMPEEEKLMMAVISKSGEEAAKYWLSMLFQGNASSTPKEVTDVAEVIRTVQTTPSSLAVIPEDGKPVTGVKILTVSH